ncbi:MAG: thiamine phosphate synthase [Oceanicaulis sp.]|uniref:thiamine phosphate synthase n=1 Tax=Glycocaulis sp. TaxID=1969725 RepID=UPI0025C65BEA|nr:thiamine phosphate synthase [Glycocaulis sp.]MCC5981746.1 thiamine phosphate synthase [Oceanicaulis sp.]MCH8520845.1 thiamine phosphate synthase [Glycocaulis sp.]
MTSLTYARSADLASASLPRLFAFTDPQRTPDPLALAQALGPGTGLILRHFGREDLKALAKPLAQAARRNRFALLIAADPALAIRVKADGVHWPERLTGEIRRWRFKAPHLLVTASAHSPAALRRAARLADGVFLSPVFPSQSPSAGAPLGLIRAASMARQAARPVFALGGVEIADLPALEARGFYGAGAVEAFSSSISAASPSRQVG